MDELRLWRRMMIDYAEEMIIDYGELVMSYWAIHVYGL